MDGFVHPFTDLHTVETFRSSAKRPNIQNQPVRNPMIGKIVRRCYIPREGHWLVEIDYSALEFKIAACFWKDPEMVKYASDDSLDIHRDMAARLFLCERDQVTKKMRYHGKNGFVFPHLYGSYYGNIGPAVWWGIDKLEFEDGTSVKQHLRMKGIQGLNEFTEHIKQVEEWFDRKFHVFAESRDKWYNDYRARGGFPFMTGFWASGMYSKNETLNTPIQGPAFHCLLWSLPRIQKWVDKTKSGALIVAEIHDSILSDAPIREVGDYVSYSKYVMTKALPKAWPWIIVPLKVEVEVAEKNWHEKEPWKETV